MATTYTKTLKSLTIKTIGGQTITAVDTATDPIGSEALAQFNNFQTMVIRGEGTLTYIPFHAVDSIIVTVSQSESITRADAYGCDE